MINIQLTRLQRRLLPLHAANFAGGLLLWPPTEKLFMSGIGFTAAQIGVMAAAYAVLTPIIEVPSGILADRWSRKGLLILAYSALLAATLCGGLSSSVPSYITSMLFFSVFFGLQSGTVDAIVYDTVLEETGSSDRYQIISGRLRALSSLGLLAGALAGGALATASSPRTTFFATVPFLALCVIFLAAFREPLLHRRQQRPSLWQQIATTSRAVLRTQALLPVAGYLMVTGMLSMIVWEFNQLWLLHLAAPVAVYGPFMALLFLADVVGGLVAGRVPLERPAVLSVVVSLLASSSLLLVVAGHLGLVAAGLFSTLLLLAVVGVYVNRLLHDAVPSEIRAGVGSGIGAFTWILFTPTALGFGAFAQTGGVHSAGWLLVAAATASAGLLIKITADRRRHAAPAQLLPVPSGGSAR